MRNFIKLLIKYRPKLIIALTSILVILGLINFYFIFDITAQSNDECLWIPKRISNDSLVVNFDVVKFEGVTWNAGIRDGDQLLAIDGVKITNTRVATETLNRVHQGDYATYTVARNGNVFETKVLIKKLINIQGLAVTLLSFIWLIVGFVVVMAKPDGHTQHIFYRIGVFAIQFSMFSLLFSGSQIQNPVFQIIPLLIGVDFLWSFGACFLPFTIVHFFMVFPKKANIIKKIWFNRALYIAPAVIFLASMLYRVFFVYFKVNDKYNILVSFHFGLVIIGGILGFVFLFRNYLKLETKQERNAIFVILISYFIGIASIIYSLTLANAIAGTIFNNPQYFMPVILIALIPISFAYSIFRYSLMDISDVVKNTIMYATATIALAGVYFFVIYGIGQSVSAAIGTEYQGVIAGVIFILFAIVFQSTRDKFQDIITQKFYPEQFAFQKVLMKFSSDVTSIVGLDNILDSTTKIFVEALKLDKFGIALKNEEENTFQLKRLQGIGNKSLVISNKDYKIKKALAQKNSVDLQPVIERVQFEEIFQNESQFLIDEGIYTVIPLLMKSKIIGLLLFGLKHSGAQFAGKDLDLLVAAANQTAVSIENARLYESEAQKLRLEKELENARLIQESLLPKKTPYFENLDVAGKMIPAMQVGGDYYDLIKVSDTKLFVVIGDVSGKGLSASFYMSKLQTMIRLFCTADKTPKSILTEINKNIYTSIEKNWFITVTLALFDLEKKTVKFCRAGHTPLMRIRNEKVENSQPAGIGVGLEAGDLFAQTLVEEELTLQNNDLFVFYSDGVNEAMNKEHELFGEQNMEKLLLESVNYRPTNILNTLINTLATYRGETPQNDDITVILVKYQG